MKKITFYAVSIGIASLCAVAVLSLMNPGRAAAAAYKNDLNCTDNSTEFNVVVVARILDYNGNVKGYANNFSFHVNAFDTNMAYRDWGPWSGWYNKKTQIPGYPHDQYDSKHDASAGGVDDTVWRGRSWTPWTWYNSNNDDGLTHDQYSNEAEAFRKLKSEAIRLWDNQFYYKTGVNADFVVQMDDNFTGTTADTDGMISGRGNACQFGSTIVPAYAFRDGDNTTHRTLDDVNSHSSPYGPLGTHDQGHALNNKSWSLSCLGQSDSANSPIKNMYFSFTRTGWDGNYVTSASAYTSRSPAKPGGTWSPPVTLWADNGASTYALFDYREPTPPTVKPSSLFDKSEVEEGDQFKTTAKFENQSAGTATGVAATWDVWLDKGDQILNAGDQDLNASNISGHDIAGGGASSTDFSGLASSGYAYVCSRLSGLTSTNDVIFNPNPPPVVCLPIVKKPYFSVLNGDVNAAMPYTCTDAPTGTIKAFNQGSAGNYKGSGTSIAAIAAGSIDQFASANKRAADAPRFLTFANDSTGPEYGGFGTAASSGCMSQDDFTSAKNSAVVSVVLPASVAGNIDPFYIKGNVYIDHDIDYAASMNLGNIPNLKLVVDGNIYIAANVHRLSGIYKATGTIYTCATGLGVLPPAGDNSVNGWAQKCNQPLTVQGALVAKNIRLMRTLGSLKNAPADPAETVIFSPEVWLRAIPGTVTSSNDPYKLNDTYDSITSLPPIL